MSPLCLSTHFSVFVKRDQRDLFSFSSADSDNESKDGSTVQEKKHGRVSQPINTIAYTVSAYMRVHVKRHN